MNILSRQPPVYLRLHPARTNAFTDQEHDQHMFPIQILSSEMEANHGYTCSTGCIDRNSVKAGSILRYSPNCLADITRHDMVDESVVILRLSTLSSSHLANGDDFYHCAVVSGSLLIRVSPMLTRVDQDAAITRAGPISSNPPCSRSEHKISP